MYGKSRMVALYHVDRSVFEGSELKTKENVATFPICKQVSTYWNVAMPNFWNKKKTN